MDSQGNTIISIEDFLPFGFFINRNIGIKVGNV